MSTNLKSGNAIVRLLLAHGEKLGILAILVCTVLIVWKAVGRDRLDKEPAQLTNLAKETDNQLENSSWASLREQSLESVVIAEPLPDTAMAKVSADHFPPFQSSFNPPVSDPVTLRMDPEILAVADLEVNSDSGLWASANPEMIRQKMLDAEKERLQEEREREAERERAGRDGRGRRGGGGPGGYGTEGGGYGGAGGRLGGRNDKPARDAPIVQRSREGAQLQGFEDIQAKSWVTILGRLPIKKQYNIYSDALATSRGYNQAVDKPNYLAYEVQRAEITSKGQGEWERIKINNKARLEKEMATYPVNVADVIDPKVNHPFLTHPLPPLILQEWGERVSHSSMPLAAEIALQKMEEMKNPEDEEEDEKPAGEPAGEDDLFADVVTRREKMKQGGRTAAAGGYGGEFGGYGGEGGGYGRGAGGYGGGYGGEFGGEGGYGGGYGGEFGGEGGYGGGYGGEFGGGGYGGMRGTMGQGSGVELAEFVLDQETEDVLFRYFDNTAQPGRSYRYRVRLALADVNHGVEEQHLDKSVTLRREETGKKKYRWTEWSEPSPVASVPLPARIYLVKTDPVKEDSYTSEPEAEILIKALNSEFAAEVARTEEFSRGSVINIVDKAKVIWAGKIDQVQFPSFEFLTGITVLDCAGGEKLGRDMLAPSRVLLMDAAGHLFVQDEMDDLEEVEEYEAVIEQEDSTRGRGGRGGPEGGYGGGYGGEFGGEGGYGGY